MSSRAVFVLLGSFVAIACATFDSANDGLGGPDGGADATAAGDASTSTDASADAPPSEAGPSAASSAAYAAAVSEDTPLGYWRLTETAPPLKSATSAENLSLTSNQPRLALPGLFSGVGSAVEFDGETNERLVASNIPMRLPTSEFAVEVWVRFVNSPDATKRFIFAHATTTLGYGVSVTSGAMVFEIFNSGTNRSVQTTPPATGTWHHIVAQSPSDWEPELWVDGVKSATATVNADSATTAFDLSFGAAGEIQGSLLPSQTKIAELAFYEHLLDGARIGVHYELGTKP